jgi:hypothetical protein
MSSDAVEKAKKILSNSEKLKAFAMLNGISIEMARALLERFMREPKVSENVEKHIFSDEASRELKSYYSGEEKGHYRGHEAGFAKGASVGLLGGLAIAVLGGVTLYFLLKKMIG